MNTPRAYLLLGPAGSGRRRVLADLIGNGLDETARPVLLSPRDEVRGSGPVEEDPFAEVDSLIRQTWHVEDKRVVSSAVPDGATDVFILFDGQANPVDQIEAIHTWLPSAGLALARVITVVHCQLASEHPELMRWYDACVHFSDVVLLNRREGVPNKWISDFVSRYRKQHFPCLIEMVKKGEVENPMLVLEPEARRMSMLFDVDDVSMAGLAGEIVIEDEEEGDEEEEAHPSADDVEDEDLVGQADPYVERLAGSGRRAKEIPDIARYL